MKKRINIILVIIWLIIIFIMSSFNATDSSNQSGIIVNFIAKLLKIENISILSVIIRKLAHFSEYLILGILVFNINNHNKKWLIISIIICLLYAISDEIHQIFVPGRSCQIIDMVIDLLGALTGILIYKLIKRILIKGDI